MTANELAHRTIQRLGELGLGADSVLPTDLNGVIFFSGPNPCLIVCRSTARLALWESIRGIDLPILRVRDVQDVERLSQLLAFAATQPDMPGELEGSSVAFWKSDAPRRVFL